MKLVILWEQMAQFKDNFGVLRDVGVVPYPCFCLNFRYSTEIEQHSQNMEDKGRMIFENWDNRWYTLV